MVLKTYIELRNTTLLMSVYLYYVPNKETPLRQLVFVCCYAHKYIISRACSEIADMRKFYNICSDHNLFLHL